MARNRISLTIFLAVLAAAMIVFAPSPAAARVHVGVYGGWYGPYYPYGPYGYWGPYYAPYAWGPYGSPYDTPYGYGARRLGEVHIKSPDRDARVYINGSYAGRAHDLKRFYLKPGSYTIELRLGGGQVMSHRIYVLADRSVRLDFTRAGPDVEEPPPPPPKD